MNDDELAAVIAAATALLRAHAPAPAAPRSAWSLAARLGALEAPLARTGAQSPTAWRMSGRLRG